MKFAPTRPPSGQLKNDSEYMGSVSSLAPREEKRQLEKPDKMEHGDYPTARRQRNMAVPTCPYNSRFIEYEENRFHPLNARAFFLQRLFFCMEM